MNKNLSFRICVVLSALLLLASGCASSNSGLKDIYIGMTWDEFIDIIPVDQSFSVWDYTFYHDEDGNSCVVRWEYDTKTHEIAEIQKFDKTAIDKTEENFSKIQEGMTVYEVVALVGIPDGIYTSGLSTLCYDFGDGYYCVYVNTKYMETLPVVSCNFIEATPPSWAKN